MILINGERGDLVSALDRGLQYGDGLFETLAIRDGEAQLWERHLRRLGDGCRRLGMAAPDDKLLAGEAARLCADHQRAVLKIVVTRGPGGRGYRSAPLGSVAGSQTRIVMRLPAPPVENGDYRDGVSVRWCRLRLGINPALAGLKHLNRLEQVLARAEWDDAGIREGLMMDGEGAVVEATSSNLFIVTGGRLQTPALDRCGVAGIMRGLILETASSFGLAVSEARLTPEDVAAAEEVFLSNSLIGIWPVRNIEDTEFAVGPITRRLITAVGQYSLMER